MPPCSELEREAGLDSQRPGRRTHDICSTSIVESNSRSLCLNSTALSPLRGPEAAAMRRTCILACGAARHWMYVVGMDGCCNYALYSAQHGHVTRTGKTTRCPAGCRSLLCPASIPHPRRRHTEHRSSVEQHLRAKPLPGLVEILGDDGSRMPICALRLGSRALPNSCSCQGARAMMKNSLIKRIMRRVPGHDPQVPVYSTHREAACSLYLGRH